MPNRNEWDAECAAFNRYIGLDVLAETMNITPLPETRTINLRPVCLCGLDIMDDYPIVDALQRYVAFRCPQCFRLVVVSRGSGQRMWYTVERQDSGS